MSSDHEGAPPEAPSDPVADHESIRVGPGSDWHPDAEKGLEEAIAGDTVPMPDLSDEGYEPDDPKHSSWRERLAAIWDSRPGK